MIQRVNLSFDVTSTYMGLLMEIVHSKVICIASKLEYLRSLISTLCTHLPHHFFLPTSEVKLLYWFSTGSLLVLVVRNGGVFENKPVLFVCPQCQSFGPDVGQKKIMIIIIAALACNGVY